MKYLLLAYADERRLEAMSGGEREALRNACLASDEALRASGHLLAALVLQGSRAAATVSLQDGCVSVSVGPCAETDTQLAGVFTIDARDLNEAIQVAATMPQRRAGPIEVRPLAEFDIDL